MQIDANTFILMLIALPLLVGLFAIIDYVLFSKNGACEKCGLKPKKYDWVVACFLETLMFLFGFISGVLL